MSTASYTLQSGCKINLSLRIKEKMPNGYHSLETFFLPVATPADSLIVTHTPHSPDDTALSHGLCRVSCNLADIDVANNTITKAYTVFAQATGFFPHLEVQLIKRVPHGAGLGGGSANAAVFLLFLQQLAAKAQKLTVSSTQLVTMAATIGADVPFFLLNKPAVATGIGEQLTPQDNPFAGATLLLVCPPLHISTKWAFQELDNFRKKNNLFVEKSLTSSPNTAIYTFAHAVQYINDFEEVVYSRYPQLAAIRNELKSNGATLALLSGTGSTVFGIFPKQELATQASKVTALSQYTTYLTSV